MKLAFYSRIAWMGIKKNGRMYVPYLLSSAGMVMMCYILAFLSESTVLQNLPGGATLMYMLDFGKRIISLFALIFLFYTNSFLIRRRKREFGMYNILGMDKWNLCRVLFLESLMTAGISILGGLLAGILFSKFAELAMVNILREEAGYAMTISPGGILYTLKMFAGIFFLIFIYTLWHVFRSSPMELLRSENFGEKPPKANWAVAVMGTALLAAAYYIAISVADPVNALIWFFVAVTLVIIATYLLFIAGSVAICRILQKRKSYYYRADHFVSVSSMGYRMKRNGAGLASICILCTMVLVILSATTCLYIGAEDVLRQRYPRHISVSVSSASPDGLPGEMKERVLNECNEVFAREGQEASNVLEYRAAVLIGYLSGSRITSERPDSILSMVWTVFLISLEDYNRMTGEEETLAENEILLCANRASDYSYPTLTLEGMGTFSVKKSLPEFLENAETAADITSSLLLVVPDYEGIVGKLNSLTEQKESHGELRKTEKWYYYFDLSCPDEEQIRVYEKLKGKLVTLTREDENVSITCESIANDRSGFYSLYGGLFFLGILLGIVFVAAAVLIMYYKQISEGYEDQGRFAIMQKVGMTSRDIRKSINSQMRTVFFLPLLAAGLHLAFAFPMLEKMLRMFSFRNVRLFGMVTVCCFLVYAVLYTVVYRVTSGAYYRIVSG